MRNPQRTSLIVLSITAMLASGAHAADWTGGGGDTLWQTGGNWSTGLEPAAGESAVFGAAADNATITFNADTADVLIEVLDTASTGLTLDVASFQINLAGNGNPSLEDLENTPENTPIVFQMAAGAGPVLVDGDFRQSVGAGRWVNNSSSALTFQGDMKSFANRFVILETGEFRMGAGGGLGPQVALRDGASFVIETNLSENTFRGFVSLDSTTTVTAEPGNSVALSYAISDAEYAGALAGEMDIAFGRGNFNDQNDVLLSGDNTYTGVSTIYTGKLYVNGTHIGGGEYTVSGSSYGPRAGAGTLGGTGSVDIGANNVTVNTDPASQGAARATLTAGIVDDTESLDITAASVILQHSQLLIELAAAGASDVINITGGLDLSSADDMLNLVNLGDGFDGSAYTIATFDPGTLVGEFDAVTGLDAAYTINYDNAGGLIQLVSGGAVAGDYNGDGVVDPSDYAFWSNQYAAELGGGTGDLAADGNGDGVIDPSDYAFWSNEYAATLGGGAAVPEPASLALLGLGGLMVARRRRTA